jgi:hypothetical protein
MEPNETAPPLQAEAQPAKSIQSTTEASVKPPSATAPVAEKVVISGLKKLKDLEQDFLTKHRQKVTVPLTLEGMLDAWNTYSETVDSPSLKQFMQDAELSLADERLMIRVGTQMAKGMIQQDSGIMEYLREKLDNPDITMNVEVDTTLAPERIMEDKGPTTPKEIFVHLAEKNPLLYELQKRFDLTVDAS